MSAEYYLVGRIRRAHGIRGEVVVEPLTDAPDALFASGRRVFAGTVAGELSPERRELVVSRSSPFKGGLIVAFAGIDDRTTAEAWRNRTLLVPEEEVPERRDDEIFLHELVGMRVVRLQGDEVGTVREVLELPQGIVIDVDRTSGGTVMLPFDDHTVTAVDADARVIHVDPVEGLLD